jgi:CubicO group peptidase (beta-lactamase class C family)
MKASKFSTDIPANVGAQLQKIMGKRDFGLTILRLLKATRMTTMNETRLEFDVETGFSQAIQPFKIYRPNMHMKLLSILLLSAIVIAPASATETDQSIDAKTRANALLAGFNKPGSPGCAVGVYQNGNVVYEGAYGLANLEHRVPIDPQRTVFGIGSVSKQFTAASILLLVQDGKLKLDDDIRKYLPEIPDYGNTITIDQLLHHTSGVRDFYELWWMSGRSQWDYTVDQDALKLLSRQTGLSFTPGSKFAYSNTGYFLLSQIVQRVSGKTLAEFARERIFSPLEMKNTYFEDTLGRVTPHRASGYTPHGDKAFEVRKTGWTLYGDTGVQTTLGDLAKWQRNFDEPKVGGAWLIVQLEQKGVLSNGKEIAYARGIEVHDKGYRGLRTVMHNGATWEGYRASLMRFPGEKLSVAVLCNSADEGDTIKLRDQLADIYMEDTFPKPETVAAANQKPEPAPKPSASAERASSALLGTYWNREDITIRRIERSDGKWWYVRSPESRSELMPIENGQLQMLGVSTRVVIKPMPSENGRQIVHVVNETPAILEKVEPASSDAKTLNDYAGIYTHPDLDGVRWTFKVKDGKLTLLPPLEGIETLNPVFKDAFQDAHWGVLFVFQRDASGRVTSLLVDMERMRNMVFSRVSE